MALRLVRTAFLANRATQCRSVLPMRGGGGGPLAQPLPPNQPLPEEDELIWDDGTANPEACLDQFDLVSKWKALGMLCGGLSIFVVLGFAAKWSAPQERVPWAPRQFPVEVTTHPKAS